MEKDDTQLLKEYADGDMRAFERLYAKHKGGTYRFFLRQTDQQTAEDLLQELWKKVVMNAAKFEANAKFSTWLYKMAKNLLIDNHRHLFVVDKVIDVNAGHSEGENSIPESMSSDKQYHQEVSQKALMECLQKLPRTQIESFLLKQEAGFTQSEIAEIVDASLEAIKSRIKTAIKNLRDCVVSSLGQEVA